MLHLRMNMPFALMGFYGSLMIIIVLFLRALLKNRLPKFVFPALWCMVLIRLLVPFSLSSPLSIKVSDTSPLSSYVTFINDFVENNIIAQTAYGTVLFQSSDVYAQATEAYDSSSPILNAGSARNDTATAVTDSSSNNSAAAITGSAGSDSAAAIAQVAETSVIESGNAAYPADYAGKAAILHPFRRIPFTAIYFLGVLITAGILSLQKYRYQAKLKNSLLIEHNETVNSLLRDINMSINGNAFPLVFTNDEIASPFVCGLLAPRIYLPTRMDFQNTELLRHILTHEAMHIKHRDNWVKAIMLIALCLNWFNPLVWLMSKCLSSDLETACDAAVLSRCQDAEARKNYAFSLLAMAITKNRATLLYSAFSKTEVEKRIKSILSYKKASVMLLAATAVFMLSAAVAFATCIEAPFSSYLTRYCSSDSSRWGVQAYLTRDIALGKDPQRRAEDIVFDVLRADTANDPELMEIQLKESLSNEFNVEKSAFRLDFSLCLSDEERKEEYETYELTKDKQGFFLYKGETVRTFVDKTAGFYQSREGSVDITIHRDRYGYISDVSAAHEGDSEYDRRTRDNERGLMYGAAYNRVTAESAETTLAGDYGYSVW